MVRTRVASLAHKQDSRAYEPSKAVANASGLVGSVCSRQSSSIHPSMHSSNESNVRAGHAITGEVRQRLASASKDVWCDPRIWNIQYSREDQQSQVKWCGYGSVCNLQRRFMCKILCVWMCVFPSLQAINAWLENMVCLCADMCPRVKRRGPKSRVHALQAEFRVRTE